MIKKLTVAIVLAVALHSCTDSSATNDVINKPYAYFNENIGWEIVIPAGFEIVDGDQIYNNNKEGIEQTENSTGQKMDTALLVNAFSFQKDSSTIFQSIVLPNAYDSLQEWLQNNQGIKALFYTMYADQGVVVDSSETEKITIGGKEFYRYELKLKNNKGEVKMQQTFYNAYFEKYELNVTLLSENDESKNMLESIFETSTFK